MRKFVLFMLAAASVLRASSFSTASCTLGTTTITSTTSCSLEFVNPDWTSGSIEADAIVSPLHFVEADAGILPPGVSPLAGGSASGSAGWTEIFTTPGPPRSGVIAILLGSFGEEGGTGSVSFGPYGSTCSGPSCDFSDPSAPFELGTPFTISLFASAIGGGCGDDGCTQGGATIDFFALFEADGTTPVGLLPVPEPSGFGPLLLSMIACCGGATQLRFRHWHGARIQQSAVVILRYDGSRNCRCPSSLIRTAERHMRGFGDD